MIPIYIIKKRDGSKEEADVTKIENRIQQLCFGLNMDYIKPTNIAISAYSDLCQNVRTVDIDTLLAENINMLSVLHPDHTVLAARIAISKLYKETKENFSDVVNDLYNTRNDQGHTPIISTYHYDIIMNNINRLNNAIKHDRDNSYTFPAIQELVKYYLLKINGKVVERPQHLIMRVSIGIHGEDIDAAIETYYLMSLKYFIHASPTMFYAATPTPQLSSSFTVANKSDSLKDFGETVQKCAQISELSGGIGVHLHSVSAKGTIWNSYPKEGLVECLKVLNDTAQHCSKRSKRPAAICAYIEPWHADIYTYTELRRNTGIKEEKTRDLFIGLWIPDEFMRRVEDDQTWSLMCPLICPGLSDVWGEDFVTLYKRYENEKKYNKQVPARELWFRIITAQIETGTPFMMYKDACNLKSNQKNLGTIKSCNLCTEVIQYSSPEEVAVCSHASIAVNMFLKLNGEYDFEMLKKITKVVTKNLNRVIDATIYPFNEDETSNKKHRPIGIGVQGLANLFASMQYPFGSPESRKLNIQIFETLYYGALEASCELAEKYGTYSSYKESPISQGILQYDMWKQQPSKLWNWPLLKEKIAKYGVRNSLLLSMMPTTNTSKILGNNDMTEPFTTNLYYFRGRAGEFCVSNRYLVNDLIKLNLWNADMINALKYLHGSIQKIQRIPENIKKLYLTNWEIPQKVILEMAADRGPYIDQSQTTNLYFEKPIKSKISSAHFFGWKNGLKSSLYYLRTRPAADPIPMTVNKVAAEIYISQTQDD